MGSQRKEGEITLVLQERDFRKATIVDLFAGKAGQPDQAQKSSRRSKESRQKELARTRQMTAGCAGWEGYRVVDGKGLSRGVVGCAAVSGCSTARPRWRGEAAPERNMDCEECGAPQSARACSLLKRPAPQHRKGAPQLCVQQLQQQHSQKSQPTNFMRCKIDCVTIIMSLLDASIFPSSVLEARSTA